MPLRPWRQETPIADEGPPRLRRVGGRETPARGRQRDWLVLIFSQPHADLVELPVDLWPYEPLATRIWQLRPDLTTYDAAYVALAEALDLPLVTLDQRVQRAPGITCAVETPSAPA
jgi:hypothetical protein